MIRIAHVIRTTRGTHVSRAATPRPVRALLAALVLGVAGGAGGAGVAGVLGAQAPPVPSDSAVRAILADRVRSKRAVGLVVATLDGRRPATFTAGSSGTPEVPLDGDALFEIGSVTKVFTTSLLAEMVARGEVKLDDPVARYLPASVSMPTRGGAQITLLDLATHSSALPRLPSNLRPADSANPYADYSVEQMYAFLSSYTLPRDIGAEYEYSNLGMGLLGHALARRAGTSYEALLTERILRPLGMSDTRIVLTGSMRARLVPGHDPAGEPVHNWDLPTLAGAGALRSTANDMLRFLAANLDSTGSPLGRALASARAPRRGIGTGTGRIGLGWHIRGTDGGSLVWHNGATGGYRTFLGIDEARRTGVIVLANMAESADDVGFHLLDPRLPLAAPTPAPAARTAVEVAPAVLDRYVGVYELSPEFRIRVSRDGDALFAEPTGQPRMRIFAESDSTFFLRTVDAQLTFGRDAGGAVTHVVLHQGGRKVPGRKVE